MNKLEFHYEPPPIDVITIEGVKYAGDLFRTFGGPLEGPVPGQLLKLVKEEDGVVHIKSYLVDEAIFEAWQARHYDQLGQENIKRILEFDDADEDEEFGSDLYRQDCT